MVKKKAYFLDADYVVRKGRTYVRLLVKGKKTTRLYYRYDPYFLSDAPIDKKEDLLKLTAMKQGVGIVKPLRIEETERIVGQEKKKYVKVVCREPSHVPLLKSAMPFKCYESSIPFGKRFIFDMELVPFSIIHYEREGRFIKKITKIEDGNPSLTALAFDIETYNPVGLPREDKDPIIMIGYSGENSGVLTWKPVDGKQYTTLADERAMLKQFNKIIEQENPDVVLGYNSANFDLPYLWVRSDANQADLCMGRWNSKMKKIKKGLINGLSLEGRTHMDIYPLVRFFGFIGVIKATRFTLDAIAEEVIGKRKIEVNKDDIWKLWDKGDIEKLSEYCLRDAELTQELGRRLLPLEVELSKITKIPLFDVSLSTSGQMVENLLMYNASKKKHLIPPKPVDYAVSQRLANPIQGAFVKLPEPGIYDNIAVLDFRGLYPTIIVSYNIDPGTLVKDGKDVNVSPSGAKFLKNELGLVPSVLDWLIDYRAELKRKLKKLDKDGDEHIRVSARSQAVKILTNSIAGDEPLLLLDPNEKIRIVDTAEFIEPRLRKEFIGKTQVGDAKGWKAACFIGNKICFKKIKKVMQHRARELLELELKSGRKIKITDDHSVFTLDSNVDIVPIKGKDLKKDQHIVVPKKMNSLSVETRVENEVNLIKVLADAPEEETKDLRLVWKLGQKAKLLPSSRRILEELDEENYATEIGRNIGMRYRSVSNHLRKLETLNLIEKTNKHKYGWFNYKINNRGKQHLNFLSKILPHMKYNGNSRLHFIEFNSVKKMLLECPSKFLEKFYIGPCNGEKIKPVIRINEKLARLLGYYVSEGYSRKWVNWTKGHSYRSEIINYDQKILADMHDTFKELGVKVEKTKRSVQSNTKMSYLIFKYVFKAGENAHKKTIPELIINNTKKIKENFIYAYFLGDGGFMKKQKMYRFTTVSKKLANGLVFILLNLGIKSVTISQDSKFYRIHVWEDIEFIGMNRNKKSKKHFSNSVPGKYIEKEIRKLKNIRYYSAINKRISKKQLQRFYRDYQKKFGRSKKIARLLSKFNGDLSFDKIKNIKKIKKKQFVYDLSVDEGENFIGGFGWTCLHNSFYGYLGYARSRWYSRECAESVTAWGRQHIMQTIETGEKLGFKVIYADSLPYDRYIFIKTKKDEIQLTKIGKFVRENKNNPKINQYSTLAYDKGSVKFKPIKRVIEHNYDSKKKGELLEITTTHGKTIVTPQHSIYYFNKGIKLTDAKKLKKEDMLISLTNPQTNEKYKMGHMFDVFSCNYEKYTKELRAYQDNLKFPAGKVEVCPYCKKRRYLATHVNMRHGNRKVALNRANSKHVWLGAENAGIGRIPRYWELNEELAWILGYYCADGSVSEYKGKDRKFMLSFGSQDEEKIKKVKKFFDRVLLENLKIIKDYDKRIKKYMYYYRVQRLPIVALIRYGFSCGKGSDGKSVPYFIYSSEEQIKRAFLKGYLDGDGNSNKERRYNTHFHKFCTKSEKLAIGLQFLFKTVPHGKNYFGKQIKHVAWHYRKDKPGVFSLRLQAIKTGKKECKKYCLAKIKSIKKQICRENVYDLEVEGCHNFVDAEGLILVHNTDSTFLLMRDKEKEDVMKFMDEVNKTLPEKMELELEGFYPRGVFVGKKGEKEARGAKKKYALLGEDGKTKIRGFELVRRDWSHIAKDTQKRVLEAILKEGSKEKAASIVKETVKRLQSGKVPLEELAITTQLKKAPEDYEVISPELSAAKKAIAKGKQMEKGTILQYVITPKGNSISEKAELLEYATSYDADYYINNQVLPSVMKILKELGYDEYGLKVGGKQQSLDNFF